MRWPRPPPWQKHIVLKVTACGLVDFSALRVAVSGDDDYTGLQHSKTWARAISPTQGRWSWQLPLEDCFATCIEQACVCSLFLVQVAVYVVSHVCVCLIWAGYLASSLFTDCGGCGCSSGAGIGLSVDPQGSVHPMGKYGVHLSARCRWRLC